MNHSTSNAEYEGKYDLLECLKEGEDELIGESVDKSYFSEQNIDTNNNKHSSHFIFDSYKTNNPSTTKSKKPALEENYVHICGEFKSVSGKVWEIQGEKVGMAVIEPRRSNVEELKE